MKNSEMHSKIDTQQNKLEKIDGKVDNKTTFKQFSNVSSTVKEQALNSIQDFLALKTDDHHITKPFNEKKNTLNEDQKKIDSENTKDIIKGIQNNIQTKINKIESMPTYDLKHTIYNLKTLDHSEKKLEIRKMRALIEFSRETGAKISENFQKALEESRKDNTSLEKFKEMPAGKKAMELIKSLPHPFKNKAYKMLNAYEQTLKNRIKIHTNNHGNQKSSQQVFKEIFDTDNKGEIKHFMDDFATYFEVRSFDDYYEMSVYDKKTANRSAGFSGKRGDQDIIVTKNIDGKNSSAINNKIYKHEREHALHKASNPFIKNHYDSHNFDFNRNIIKIRQDIKKLKISFQKKLKKAKDEILAYRKGGISPDRLIKILTKKDTDGGLYDYNQYFVKKYNNSLEASNLTPTDKENFRQILKDLQSEYDKSVKNLVNLAFDSNKSNEYLRNIPTNRWWELNPSEYQRTDIHVKLPDHSVLKISPLGNFLDKPYKASKDTPSLEKQKIEFESEYQKIKTQKMSADLKKKTEKKYDYFMNKFLNNEIFISGFYLYEKTNKLIKNKATRADIDLIKIEIKKHKENFNKVNIHSFHLSEAESKIKKYEKSLSI